MLSLITVLFLHVHGKVIDCVFCFHREKEDQKEKMVKRFLQFTEISLNIYKNQIHATSHITVRIQYSLSAHFQGEKGDPGANVSGS